MRHAYRSGASRTAPTPPVTPSVGYPTEGDSATLTPATIPGEYWHHAVTSEIVGVIEAAGLTPDDTVVQLLAAIRALLAARTPSASTARRGLIEIATATETIAGVVGDRAVTPFGLSAMRRYLGEVALTTSADVTLNVPEAIRTAWAVLMIVDTGQSPGLVAKSVATAVLPVADLRGATTMSATGSVGWRITDDIVVAGRMIDGAGFDRIVMRLHRTGTTAAAPIEHATLFALY